jgi:hypothetical protein
MTALVAVLGLVVALLAVLVVGLLRSHADIIKELHDLRQDLGGGPSRLTPSQVRPGVALPRGTGSGAQGADLVGVDADGDAMKLAVSGTDQSTLLLFLSSGCLTCRAFWDALADRSTLGLDPSIRAVAVTKGPEEESLAAITALAPAEVQTILTTAAWDDYGVPVAPYAILVDQTGRVIGEGAAATWEQVRDLMHQALADAGAGHDADLRRRVESLRRRRGATGDRDAATDEVLLAAGIGPDHPSVWEQPVPQDPSAGEHH